MAATALDLSTATLGTVHKRGAERRRSDVNATANTATAAADAYNSMLPPPPHPHTLGNNANLAYNKYNIRANYQKYFCERTCGCDTAASDSLRAILSKTVSNETAYPIDFICANYTDGHSLTWGISL